jgi:hypothetical protein
MIVRSPHLQDDVLFDCYYATRRGEALDPPSAEHLADCDACAGRYGDLGTFLNTLGEEADVDVSALFPPERLREQQHEIARRLELVGRAARVISFPGRTAGPGSPGSPVSPGSVVAQTPRTSASRLAARWVAAAAAAGLFVGVAAGTVFNFGPRFEFARDGRRAGMNAGSRQAVTSTLPARLSPAAAEKAVKAVVDLDDMFMSDLESVLDRPHTSELVAFDALTPHLRDIRDFAR